MHAIWRIAVGTLIAAWQFVQPDHGFWHSQSLRYYDYTHGSGARLVAIAAVMIYLAAAGFIYSGISRLLTSKAQSRRLESHGTSGVSI